jgi:hypothetical protein
VLLIHEYRSKGADMIDWIVDHPQYIVSACEFILFVAVMGFITWVVHDMRKDMQRRKRQQGLDDAEFRRLMSEYRRRMDRNLDMIETKEEVVRRVK